MESTQAFIESAEVMSRIPRLDARLFESFHFGGRPSAAVDLEARIVRYEW